MGALFSLVAVSALVLIPLVGVMAAGLEPLFGIVIPYAAVSVFIIGFVWRIVGWGRSAVPFRIPTTCGQQKSLPWIKQNKLENPSSTLGVIGRMALEVLLFRSLFRNLKFDMREGPKLSYGSEKWLWLAGMAFHWSFLIIAVRHFRFFLQKVPFVITGVERLDSYFQIGAPLFYITDAVVLAAVGYLFIRRFYIPQIRYISLANDYFPLLLIFSIGVTGVLMRYFLKTHIVGVKELTMGLVSFSPKVPEGVGVIFYIHFFLVCTLLAYIPFSKIMHMGGVFMSPTRNLRANSREIGHVNPWDYPVKLRKYEEYENDFREKMKGVGIPVEKE